MKRINLLIMVVLCTTLTLAQKKNVTFSGKVIEASSNESLFGVSIALTDNSGKLAGGTSNEYGFFSISVPSGVYHATISYLGFQTQEFELNLNENIRQDISLSEEVASLDEVVVTSKSNPERVDIKKAQMSKNVLTLQNIKQMPSPLGEPDLIQSLMLFPGVTNAGEISSGFNVRGGSSDQNLVLLDEAMMFTTSHMFGLLSIFNTMATKDITLYKGSIPARYGGRVASVLDVYQKEGNSKEFKGAISAGTLAVSGMLEGPIKKDKSSFLVAARITPSLLGNINNSKVGFYDLNTKLSYNLNKNNTLYLSGYFGRDILKIGSLFDTSYGNTFINGRWNHIFGSKLFSNLSMIYSDYNFQLDLNAVGFNWLNSIKNFNLKYDFKYYLNDHIKLFYGVNNIYYHFNPGNIIPTSDKNSRIQAQQLTQKTANELGVYLDSEYEISDKLTVNLGLRVSQFNRFGQEFNTYANDNPVNYDPNTKVYTSADPTGTETKKGSVADYKNLEPRASLSWAFNDYNSVKMSYNRMAQYLQIISNNLSPQPFDVWAPAGPFIKPIIQDQYAIGYFKNINNLYSFEIETYYKDLQNKIDYIDGANLTANNAIEREILNGKAQSYGLELLFRKNAGKFTGFVSYTLSKSEQLVTGRTPEEIGINNGKWYNAPQNRPHILSITGNYKLSERWAFNTHFVYQSGRAISFPVGQYQYLDGYYNIPRYSVRNSEMLPAYHRLDIGATLTPLKNKNSNRKVEWRFSIYNLYNRKNAYSISFSNDEENRNKRQATKTYIFAIFPAISYNLTF